MSLHSLYMVFKGIYIGICITKMCLHVNMIGLLFSVFFRDVVLLPCIRTYLIYMSLYMFYVFTCSNCFYYLGSLFPLFHCWGKGGCMFLLCVRTFCCPKCNPLYPSSMRQRMWTLPDSTGTNYINVGIFTRMKINFHFMTFAGENTLIVIHKSTTNTVLEVGSAG